MLFIVIGINVIIAIGVVLCKNFQKKTIQKSQDLNVIEEQNNFVSNWHLVRIITGLILLSVIVRMIYYFVVGIDCGIAYAPNVCYGVNAIVWFLFIKGFFYEGIIWLISIILFIVSSYKCYQYNMYQMCNNTKSYKKNNLEHINWEKIKYISSLPFLLLIALMLFFSIVGLEPEIYGHIYYGIDAIKIIFNNLVLKFWIIWVIFVVILVISICMCYKKKKKGIINKKRKKD